MRIAKRAAVVLAATLAASCAAPDQGADIQDIGMKWIAAERTVAELASPPVQGRDLLAAIRLLDALHESATSFVDSGAYRLASPRHHPNAQAPGRHRDLPDMILELRQAAMDGDRDRAASLSSDISAAIILGTASGRATAQYLAATYFQLLLTAGVIVVLTGFMMRILYKMWARSRASAKEGSVFSRAVLVAQETERGRIYKELHDTVAQDLRRLSLGFDRIGETEEKAERKSLCAQAAALQIGIQRKVRDICHDLAPPDLDVMSLPDATLRLCHDFAERAGIECRAKIARDMNLDFLDRNRQIQFYRIVQEALSNVEKHAHASLAIVVLRSEADGSVHVSVSDDGEGFDPSDVKPDGRHLGIRGMRERAALLGGTLTINSGKGQDTLVHLRVPPPPANDGGNDGSTAD